MHALLRIIDEALGLQGRARSWQLESPLLGAVPELDSMGIIQLLTALSEHYQLDVATSELHQEVFTTVGSLLAFVETHRSPAF
jgi:acyl carrier protein